MPDKVFGGPESVDNVNEPWKPGQKYIVGDPGPNFNKPVPVNYNWLDWANNAGGVAGGMPNRAPPMSMNDRRMTFEHIYTPVEGGPWEYGLGPGPLTKDAGIPGGPGEQFVPPGEGFRPGPTDTDPPPADDGTGGGQGLGDIDRALQIQRAYAGTFGWHDGYDGPMGALEALALSQALPDVDPARMFLNGMTPDVARIMHGGL